MEQLLELFEFSTGVAQNSCALMKRVAAGQHDRMELRGGADPDDKSAQVHHRRPPFTLRFKLEFVILK